MKDSRRIIVDSGVFIAIVDSSDSRHKDCISVLKTLPETTEYVTTESCLAEVTYLLPRAEFVHKLHQILETLPVNLVCLSSIDKDRVFELLRKYGDLPMDFADASIVAIAERLKIQTVFTVDRRDFSIYRPSHVKSFRLIPQ